MKKIKKSTLIISIIFLLIIISAGLFYILKNPMEKNKEESIVIGIKSDFVGFYPKMTALETPTIGFNLNIYNTLIEYDKNYKIFPALAESWEVIDEFTWRFNLKEGVKFHNGKEFTSEDVKFTLEYVINDDQNIYKDQTSEIKSIEIIDKYTVNIKTKKPYPILLDRLAIIPMLSKSTFEENIAETPIIGTGAYKLKSYKPGEEIVLTKNENYWKNNSLIDTVIYKVILDDEEILSAFLNNKIDFLTELSPEDYLKLKDNPNYQWIKSPGTRVIFLSFDAREENNNYFGKEKNPISDIRVRKAIYHTINEDKIIDEIMQGISEKATQFVNPNIFGYNPEIKRLDYNLEIAKQLMKEAGYEKGFTIPLYCTNDRYVNDEKICQEIVNQLKEININVELTTLPKKDFWPKFSNKEFPFYMIGWTTDSGDGGEIFDNLLETPVEGTLIGGFNGGSYSNKEVDKIAEESVNILDPKERLKKIQQGFKIAADDIAWIPLHLQQQTFGLSNNIIWQPRIDELIKIEEIKLNK